MPHFSTCARDHSNASSLTFASSRVLLERMMWMNSSRFDSAMMITFEQLGAFLGLLQFKARAAQNDFAAMLDVALDDFLEIERLRPAMINRQRIDAERNFQLRVLKQIGDDDLRRAVALQFDDEPAMLVRLVAHRGNFRDDLFVDEVRDLFFERGAVDVERNFRDDELLAVALHLLHADAPAQLEAALAGREIILDALDAADEIRRSENPGL